MGSLLIENGADVNAVSKVGETPFHRAVSLGYDDITSVLAKHCSDVHKTDIVGRTAAYLAQEAIASMQTLIASVRLGVNGGQLLKSPTSAHSPPFWSHSMAPLSSVMYTFVPTPTLSSA